MPATSPPPASLFFFLLIQSLNPAKVFAAKRNPAEIEEQKTAVKLWRRLEHTSARKR
jgi:hypothetical protein